MSIIQQIESELIQALKAKNELVVLTLRQVKTAVTNEEIKNNRQVLSDDQVTKVIKSEAKKRKESIELYKQGSRNDLAQKEQQELEIISKYLPEEMGEDEIRSKVIEVIQKIGATSPAETGKVMSQVMASLQGAADGSVVSKIVKEQLTPGK
jgi:uncharacterized protein YqeY